MCGLPGVESVQGVSGRNGVVELLVADLPFLCAYKLFPRIQHLPAQRCGLVIVPPFPVDDHEFGFKVACSLDAS